MNKTTHSITRDAAIKVIQNKSIEVINKAEKLKLMLETLNMASDIDLTKVLMDYPESYFRYYVVMSQEQFDRNSNPFRINSIDDFKTIGMKKILFLDDCNAHNFQDPLAYLVLVPNQTDMEIVKKAELTQPGAFRTGGQWEEALVTAGVRYEEVSQGKRSDYNKGDYDEVYNVISGNY